MLDPRDLSILSELLEQALDLPDAAAQARWLDALPEEHARLKPHLVLALSGDVPLAIDRPLDALFGPHPVGDDYAPGGVVGPYRLIRLLGRGGMSSVWLATRSDRPSDPPVALKLPTLEGVDRGFLARFERERGFLTLLDHPAIVRMIDAGVTGDHQPYLALEYVEGLPLDRHCDDARLGIEGRLELFARVLDAVAHAHSRGVLHRDLKPSNILVRPDGEVRLLDFGIAKMMVEGEATPTELTARWGRALTPQYASPEQFAGTAATTRSDVYALGVILFELLTGNRPFSGANPRHASERTETFIDAPLASESIRVGAVVAGAEGGPAALARRLSGDLDSIVQSALRHDPADRPADAARFAWRLAHAATPSPIAGWWNVRRRRMAHVWQRQSLGIALAGITLLLLLGVGRVHRLASGLDTLVSAPRPPERQVALVSIGQADHRQLFAGARPLDPDVLGRLLTRILEGAPAAVGVDLDTSSPAYAVLRQTLADSALQRIVWARDLQAPDAGGGLPDVQPVLGGGDTGLVRSGLAVSVADGASGHLLWWRAAIPTKDGVLPTLVAELAASAPTDAARAIRYRDTKRLDLPASVVMARDFSWGERIRDRLVLLGGRYDPTDRHPTPMGTLSGLDVLAQTVETARHETSWRQPLATDGLVLGLALILWSVIAFERLPGWTALGAVAAGSAVLIAGLAALGLFENWPYATMVALAVLAGRLTALGMHRLRVRPFARATPG